MARHDRSCVCISYMPRLVLLAGADRAELRSPVGPGTPWFYLSETTDLFMYPQLLLRLDRI